MAKSEDVATDGGECEKVSTLREEETDDNKIATNQDKIPAPTASTKLGDIEEKPHDSSQSPTGDANVTKEAVIGRDVEAERQSRDAGEPPVVETKANFEPPAPSQQQENRGSANGHLSGDELKQAEPVVVEAPANVTCPFVVSLNNGVKEGPNGTELPQTGCGNDGDELEKKSRDEWKNEGWIRHAVALLALSSMVLANMNRQAWNQTLPNMIFEDKSETNETDEIDYTSTQFPITMAMVTSGEEFFTTGEGTAATTIIKTTTAAPAPITTDPAEMPTTLPTFNIPLQQVDRFNWTSTQIAWLQSAFSYGYTPFMIPGGRLAELYGAKWVVFLSSFGSALCSILTPFLAEYNVWLLVASRILMGICQTGVSPALYALLTRWLPPNESNVYLPMIKVGVTLGFTLGSFVGGLLTWRSTFYSTGLLGFLWCIMWVVLVTSDPKDHKMIKKSEFQYIKQELERLNKGRKQSLNTSRKASAPWYGIMTNPVVLAFIFAKFTVKLSTDAQTIQLPMYLKKVFHVSKTDNGYINSFNFSIQCAFTGFVAWVAKEFVVRKSFGLNKTGVRRLFQGICNFGMGFAYILMTFNMSSLPIVISSVALVSVSSMFGAGGEAVLPVDLSNQYSASIMAIANSAANLSGIMLPNLAKRILGEDSQSADLWNIVWRTVGGIVICGGLVFSLFVEAEIQDFEPLRTTSKQADKNKTDKLAASRELSTIIEMRPISSVVETKPQAESIG